MSIQVVIADDHQTIREGLSGLLAAEPDLEVVGHANNGAEAVRQVAALGPDVVLVDLRMPGVDGVTATARITSGWPDVRVVVLAAYDTDSQLPRAISAGAVGFLLKNQLSESAVTAVRAAARGQTLLSDEELARLEGLVRPPSEEPLTRRELEVLHHVARGLRNGQVAKRLFISEATVKTHLLHAYVKLGVHDRGAAVEEAGRRGLLDERGGPGPGAPGPGGAPGRR